MSKNTSNSSFMCKIAKIFAKKTIGIEIETLRKRRQMSPNHFLLFELWREVEKRRLKQYVVAHATFKNGVNEAPLFLLQLETCHSEKTTPRSATPFSLLFWKCVIHQRLRDINNALDGWWQVIGYMLMTSTCETCLVIQRNYCLSS